MFISQHKRTVHVLFALVLLAFHLTPRVSAQAVAVAEISGRVTDPSGAPVSGAQVRVTEIEKQTVRIVNTDPEPLFKVVKGKLPGELETLVMSCLSKEP